jgi:hypothetical protein
MEKTNRTAIQCGYRDSAVSEIIGAILLISIVVTAVSIVGVALWSQPAPQKIPALDAVISEDSGNKLIRLYHDGGDLLSAADVKILVDGNDYTAGFTKAGASGWSSWATGESLDYTYSGVTAPALVQIVYTHTGTSTVLAVAHLTTPVPTTTVTTTTTTVTTTTPSLPALEMYSISPNSDFRGDLVSVSITGSNFQSGATVTFTIGGKTVPGEKVVVVSPTQITCDFPIPHQGWAKNDLWDVTVANPDGQSATLPACFTVTNKEEPTPTPTPEVTTEPTTTATTAITTAPTPAPLTADFIWSKKGSSTRVMFTDTSTGVPTSWSWDFGDTTTSTEENPPEHHYTKSQSYQATLTVTRSSDGATSSITKTVTT